MLSVETLENIRILDLVAAATATHSPYPRFEGDLIGVRTVVTVSGHTLTKTPVSRACGSIGWAYECSCGFRRETATPCYDGCHSRRVCSDFDFLHSGLALVKPEGG